MGSLKDTAPLIAALEKYGNQWSEFCGCIRVYDHPLHTTLRLISGDRDVSISFDQSDYRVYVSASSRIAEESNEDWLERPGEWGRPLYQLESYVKDKCLDQCTSLLSIIQQPVDRYQTDQVQRFLSLNHDTISVFISDYLAK